MAEKSVDDLLTQFKELLQILTENRDSFTETLMELNQSAAKLKVIGVMNVIPPLSITKAFDVIETYICTKEEKLNEEPLSVKISLLSSLAILNILTSPAMDKSIYSEDTIDKIVSFISVQLYQCNISMSNEKMQTKKRTTLNRHLCFLDTAVTLLYELIQKHPLEDTTVYKVSSIGLCAFEHKYDSLNVMGIKLLTMIFSKYETQHLSVLNDISTSMVKWCCDERTNVYRLIGSSQSISTLSALLLSVLQATTALPDGLCLTMSDLQRNKGKILKEFNSLIEKKYSTFMWYASEISFAFLKRCTSKTSFKEHKKTYENFIFDLLLVVTKPEWPAAIFLLTFTAKHIVDNILDKSLPAGLRAMCLDWLCHIMVKLKKIALFVQKNGEKLDEMLQACASLDEGCKEEIPKDLMLQSLQIIFLKNMINRSCGKEQIIPLHQFYATLWLNEVKGTKCDSKGEKEEIMESNKSKGNKRKTGCRKRACLKENDATSKSILLEILKDNLISSAVVKIDRGLQKEGLINDGEEELLISYFISERDFVAKFDIFLAHVLQMLHDNMPCMRARAMHTLKCLLDVDSTLINRPAVQVAMKRCLKDTSISVREAAVELVGQCFLHNPEQCELYYHLICERVSDKGVSVRKRVMKLLKDVLISHPSFSKNPEIYKLVLLRVNDEGVEALLSEIFEKTWFTPIRSDAKKLLTDRMNIFLRVVDISGKEGFDCLQKLLKKFLLEAEQNAKIKTALEQLVSCLVEHILELDSKNNLEQLRPSMKALHILAVAKPKMLVGYVATLESYLTLHDEVNDSITTSVMGILEHTMPFHENPDKKFLVQIEEDLVNIILNQRHYVIEHSIPCFSVIVNQFTHNFKLFRDCFNKFYGIIKVYKNSFPILTTFAEDHVKRSICIIGLFMQSFDFSLPDIQDFFEKNIVNEIFETMISFLHNSSSTSILWYTLRTIGIITCLYPQYLLSKHLKTYYCTTLTSEHSNSHLKSQIISNLRKYLEHEREIKKRREKSGTSQSTKLKEMDDYLNDASIKGVQLFLDSVIQCVMTPNKEIRQVATEFIKVIVLRGLILPQKVIPYLIALSTDDNCSINSTAHSLLKDINSGHPSVVYSYIKKGIQFSFILQKCIQTGPLIRGFEDGDPPRALLSNVYSLIPRNKGQRRGFLRSFLSQMDNEEHDLCKIVYLADNLAYLPYEYEDEPFCIIDFVDTTTAISGSSYLSDFRGELFPKPSKNQVCESGVVLETDDEESDSDNDDKDLLLERFPEDTAGLQKSVLSFQSCLVLLKLRKHLLHMYGLKKSKLALYSEKDTGEDQCKAKTLLVQKNTPLFLPPASLHALEKLIKSEELDKDVLAAQYLEFKDLASCVDVYAREQPKHKKAAASLKGKTNLEQKTQNARKNKSRLRKRRRSDSEEESSDCE